MVEIGTWRVDLPMPTTPSKRKAGGANTIPEPNPNPPPKGGSTGLHEAVNWM